jgi:hypothetical protein
LLYFIGFGCGLCVGVCFIISNRLKLLFLHLFGFGKLFTLYLYSSNEEYLSVSLEEELCLRREEFDVFFCFLLHEEGEEFDAGYATFEQNMSGLC